MVSGPAPGFLALKYIAVVGGYPAPVGIGTPILLHVAGVPHRPIVLIFEPLAVLAQVVIEHGHIFPSGPGRPGKPGNQHQSHRQE
jgi:hypothetical protein